MPYYMKQETLNEHHNAKIWKGLFLSVSGDEKNHPQFQCTIAF